MTDLEQRLEKLRDIKTIQCNSGNWDYSDYMRGMANGLILALAIMEDTEPDFFKPIKKYRSDKDESESFRDKVRGWMHKAW